jgi:hypothetical protein
VPANKPAPVDVAPPAVSLQQFLDLPEHFIERHGLTSRPLYSFGSLDSRRITA